MEVFLALRLERPRCFPRFPTPFNGPRMHAQNVGHLRHTERLFYRVAVPAGVVAPVGLWSGIALAGPAAAATDAPVSRSRHRWNCALTQHIW